MPNASNELDHKNFIDNFAVLKLEIRILAYLKYDCKYSVSFLYRKFLMDAAQEALFIRHCSFLIIAREKAVFIAD